MRRAYDQNMLFKHMERRSNNSVSTESNQILLLRSKMRRFSVVRLCLVIGALLGAANAANANRAKVKVVVSWS